MGPKIYISLPQNLTIKVIKQIARSFGALWALDIPHPHNPIGRATFTSSDPSIVIESDRRTGFGGPWSSVSVFLKACLKCRLAELQRQEQIDEYKAKHLPTIAEFISNELHSIPQEVNEVPVVLMHSDMGLHNMVFSGALDATLGNCGLGNDRLSPFSRHGARVHR